MGPTRGNWWPDLSVWSFESDEWRFAAVCVIVTGLGVVPALLWYLLARRRNDQAHKLALQKVELKLSETRERRLRKSKGQRRWTKGKR